MSEFIESIIDWDKFDATSNVSQRISGVTKEAIELEVEIWNKQLKFLSPLNIQDIKEEINEWDISIPTSLDFESIAASYSKLVSYKTRISKLLADAKAWRDTCETAINYLEDLAPGAFTGTGPDKKANAAHIIQPFVHLKTQSARLENYLDKMHGSIMFCAQQLDLLIKEKQSRAKFNYKLSHQGEGIISTSPSPSEVLEEDGEVFTQISSRNRGKSRYI